MARIVPGHVCPACDEPCDCADVVDCTHYDLDDDVEDLDDELDPDDDDDQDDDDEQPW